MGHVGHPIVRLDSPGRATAGVDGASASHLGGGASNAEASSSRRSSVYTGDRSADEHFWPSEIAYPQVGQSISEDRRSIADSRYDDDSTTQTTQSDGFLGDVAQWTREDDGRSGGDSLGTRTSRLLGLTKSFGSAGPPPQGPPPRAPSPSPHPFAAPPSPSSRFARAAGRFSSTANLLRKSSNASLASRKSASKSSIAGPPSPTIPQQQSVYQELQLQHHQPTPTGLLGQPLELRQRKSSLPPTSVMHAASISPPGSPNVPASIFEAPQISPRTTSLSTPGGARQAAVDAEYPQSNGAGSSNHPYAYRGAQEGSSSTSQPHAYREESRRSSDKSKASRTPSRHLLQSALDLAQQAVEMDRNNDVEGALAAYREAVDRLRSVMDRVGVDPSGNARKSKSGKSEEEGRTLKGIHDAYVTRIRLLSSYEITEVDEPTPPRPGNRASESTATLLAFSPTTSTSTLLAYPANHNSPPPPDRNPLQDGGTPRSTASRTGAEGIGSMMLSDRQSLVSTSSSPEKRAGNGLDVPDWHDSPSRTPRADQDGHERRPVDTISSQSRPVHARRASAALQRAFSKESSGSSSQSQAGPTSSPQRPARTSRPVQGDGEGAGISRNLFDSPGKSESGASARIRALRAKPLGLDEELGQEDALEQSHAAEGPKKSLASTESAHQAVESHAEMPITPATPNGRISIDKSLPPLPPTGDEQTGRQLVNPSTAMGTISQRRLSRPLSNRVPAPSIDTGTRAADSSSRTDVSSSRRSSVTSSTAFTRSRSESRSGHSIHDSPVPPVPGLPSKAGLTVLMDGSHASSWTGNAGMPGSAPPRTAKSYNGSLISPLPQVQPREVVHRSFHLLRSINQSMDPQSTGAYLTGAVHLPPAIWAVSTWSSSAPKQTGIKINALETKARIMDQLLFHLEIIRRTTSGLLDGAREYTYGSRDPRIPSPVLHRDQVAVVARDFEDALEAFEEELEMTGRTLSKAGVAVGLVSSSSSGPASGKKKGMSGWGSKISKAVERKDKGSDDSERYVDLLAKICWSLQIIDDHLLCVSGPCTPAYHSLPEKSYRQLEAKLYRCADAIGSVIVPFVLDDTKQFLLRYLKGGVQYLEEA